jgi:hypothetical protein
LGALVGPCPTIMRGPSPVGGSCPPRQHGAAQRVRCDLPTCSRLRLLGGLVSLLGGLISELGSSIPLVAGLIPLVAGLIALVARMISVVSGPVTLIGGFVASVAGPVAPVGDIVARVPGSIPFVASLVSPLTRVISPIARTVTLIRGLISLLGERSPASPISLARRAPIDHDVSPSDRQRPPRWGTACACTDGRPRDALHAAAQWRRRFEMLSGAAGSERRCLSAGDLLHAPVDADKGVMGDMTHRA